MKSDDKQGRLQAAQSKKRIRVTRKDAVKAFKKTVRKDGKDWVITDGEREIRNRDKDSVIADWFTLNGYEVDDG